MNEPAAVSILTEHLPYELDMLEAAFLFLHSQETEKVRAIPFCRNAAIESFWLHARNLIEFLTHRPSGGAGTVSARDFAPGFDPETIMKEMDQRTNAGVSHLLYERKTQQGEKLNGYDMLRVKEHIEREIKRFEAALSPDYKKIWDVRPAGGRIETDSWLCATNATTSISVSIGYGPRGSRS